MKKLTIIFAIMMKFLIPSSTVIATAGGGGADYGGGGYTGGGYDGGYSGGYDSGDSYSGEGGEIDSIFGISVVAVAMVGMLSLMSSQTEEVTPAMKPYERKPLDRNNPEELAIETYVTEVYYAIQEAWNEGNPEKAEMYYAPELMEEHIRKLEDAKKRHEKYVTEDVIVQKVDDLYYWSKKMSMSVTIQATAIDYVLCLQTKVVLSGRREQRGKIVEVLYFVKDENGDWKLKQIRNISS